VHVGDEGLLDFTTLNPDMLNPVLRYRTGDAGELTRCSCGRPDLAMRVVGRRDSVVQVRGLGLHVDDIVARAESDPGVARAQVIITEQRGRASGVEVRVLPAGVPTPGLEQRVRNDLFGSTFTLSTAFVHDPESFQVCVVDGLVANERTGKTANFLVREEE
jgi:phenylacetate-coenzyme A ligase PaaK-like adenylate-forming protein